MERKMKTAEFKHKEEIKEYLNRHKEEKFVQGYDELMKNERVHISFETEDILKYLYYVDDMNFKEFVVVIISKLGRNLEVEQISIFEADVEYMAKKVGLI